MWWNSGPDHPAWLPGWTNGVSPQDVYEFLIDASIHHPEIRATMMDAGMRVRKTV